MLTKGNVTIGLETRFGPVSVVVQEPRLEVPASALQ